MKKTAGFFLHYSVNKEDHASDVVLSIVGYQEQLAIASYDGVYLFHHLELTRKEFRVREVFNHMPAFHVVAGIAICTPHCAANDDIHVLNLIFDTNTHDFCHSSRFFLMRSRHFSNRVISSSEKPL